MSRRTLIGLLAAFALGLAVPAALWASPVDDQYGGAPQTPVTSTVGTTTTTMTATTTTTTTSTTDAATTTSSETPVTPVERTVEQAPATTAGEQPAQSQQAAAQAGGSSLPFTGLQLGLFVAAGLAATAAGLALRRAGRRRS